MHSISSGAPFGEEQPDEVGLQLLPRDEVHAKALLQRQPDQIGEMTMMMVIYMTTIMMMVVTMVTIMMMVVTMVTIMMMMMVHALLHRQQIRSVRKWNSMNVKWNAFVQSDG